MATRRKNTFPAPDHVQALIDALEALKPAHWTASHGTGRASYQWTIYSKVFRARIDDLKINGEVTRGGYRVGILVEEVDNTLWTSFFLFDCQSAARRFKANFRPEMVEPLMALERDGLLHCIGTSMRRGNIPRNGFHESHKSSFWIQKWLNDPAFYNESQLQSFQIEIGVFTFSSGRQIISEAAHLAEAYMPLLECMVPLEGEPISARRLTRLDPLKRNLSRVVGKPEQVGCEWRRIAGFHSQSPCAGRLEAAHIHPYQHGGTGDAENGLWLCVVHHLETEGRIEGTRSLGVNLIAHIEPQRRSRLAPDREAMG